MPCFADEATEAQKGECLVHGRSEPVSRVLGFDPLLWIPGTLLPTGHAHLVVKPDHPTESWHVLGCTPQAGKPCTSPASTPEKEPRVSDEH